MKNLINVLIVEDVLELREVFSDLLKNYGYNTILAENGIDAFDKFSSDKVDIIISDVRMPKMDGHIGQN